MVPGGHWALGCGFSGPHCKEDRERVPDWTIDVSLCKLVYPDTPFSFTIKENIYGEQNEYRHYRARLVYNGGLYDAVDPADEYKRYDTVEEAQEACTARAGQGLTWALAPRNEWGESIWHSSVVEPIRKAA